MYCSAALQGEVHKLNEELQAERAKLLQHKHDLVSLMANTREV